MKLLKIVSVLLLPLCLAFSGCASGGQPVGMLTKSKVQGLPMGSTKEAVAAVLGSPEASNSRITSLGTIEVWQYSKATTVQRIEGEAAAFRYGFSRQVAGGPGATFITLTFTNGLLTSLEGL